MLAAEFMLRRTRANQVVGVYRQFAQRYATPGEVLADTPEATSALLAPLGLHWRIAQFRTLCGALVERHGGAVPSSFDDLRALPGVGAYVAAAVRVFAFHEPDALIDANVLRFLSRYFSMTVSDGSRRSRRILDQVASLVPRDRPQGFWWALLDLTALVCTPREPRHEICPLQGSCRAINDDQQVDRRAEEADACAEGHRRSRRR